MGAGAGWDDVSDVCSAVCDLWSLSGGRIKGDAIKLKDLVEKGYINGHEVSADEMFASGGPPQRIRECCCPYCSARRSDPKGNHEHLKTIGSPVVPPPLATA